MPANDIPTQEDFNQAYEFVNNTNSIIETIIVGHAYLDAKINHYLNHRFERPEYLDLSQFTYARKLKIALSLGFIKDGETKWEDLIPYYVGIGNLRNKIAHNINYKLSKEDIQFLNNINNSTFSSFAPPIPKNDDQLLKFTKFAMSALMSLAGFFAANKQGV